MFTPAVATDPDPLPTTPVGWADAIAARVGTFGIGLWLLNLGPWLGFDGRSWLPQRHTDEAQTITGHPRGLILRLRPLTTFENLPMPFRLNHIVLEEVAFSGQAAGKNPSACALPFRLDPAAETLEGVARTLGVEPGIKDDIRPGVVHYTLADGREVEVIFEPSQPRGIKGVWVRRPGPPNEAA